MVHTLLLVLGVGLVCAHPDHVPELKPSEVEHTVMGQGREEVSVVSGAWHTLYIGADNVEKVGPGGPLRALLRHLECGDTCKLLSVTFDIKVDNDCQSYTVVGEKDKDGFYTTDFLGKNYFKVIKKEKDVIVFHNFNVDVDGKETNIILVAGRGRRSDRHTERGARGPGGRVRYTEEEHPARGFLRHLHLLRTLVGFPHSYRIRKTCYDAMLHVKSEP